MASSTSTYAGGFYTPLSGIAAQGDVMTDPKKVCPLVHLFFLSSASTFKLIFLPLSHPPARRIAGSQDQSPLNTEICSTPLLTFPSPSLTPLPACPPTFAIAVSSPITHLIRPTALTQAGPTRLGFRLPLLLFP